VSKKLTIKEIYERMQELRNIRKLHQAARDRVIALEEENKRLKTKVAEQESAIKGLEAVVTKQSLQIEELRSKVFGKKKPKKKRVAHRLGTPRTKDSYHRPVPEVVTDIEHHPLDAHTCPDCGHDLEKRPNRTYYEEDIVLPGIDDGTPRTTVTKHTVECAYCPQCKKLITAIPLPRARVVLGPKVRIFITTCAIRMHASHENTRTFLREMFGFHVSVGEIAKVLITEGTILRPEHTRIIEVIRDHHAAHYDETVWPTVSGASGNYGWVMKAANAPQEAYLLGESRGKGVAEKLKGDSGHIGITDHYGAYENLFGHHQLCWAHPHRKFRDLAESETLSSAQHERAQEAHDAFTTLYADLRAVLDTPFEKKRYAHERVRLLARFDAFAREDASDFATLAKRKVELRRGRDKYFTCLLFPGIPCDNNAAERAIRPAVMKRKVSLGSKTGRGAKATEVLLTVIRTLANNRPANFLRELYEIRQKCVALQSQVRRV
jgi:transposase